MNNAAAAAAQGRLLAFVNNDVEAFAPGLAGADGAARPCGRRSGAVGAKLLDGDGPHPAWRRRCSAPGGLVTHAHRFFPGDAPGYLAGLRATRVGRGGHRGLPRRGGAQIRGGRRLRRRQPSRSISTTSTCACGWTRPATAPCSCRRRGPASPRGREPALDARGAGPPPARSRGLQTTMGAAAGAGPPLSSGLRPGSRHPCAAAPGLARRRAALRLAYWTRRGPPVWTFSFSDMMPRRLATSV